jgi:hypothetical protein
MFLTGNNKQMLTVNMHSVDDPVVLVNEMRGQEFSADVEESHLGLSSCNQIAFNEEEPCDFLAVHVEMIKLFFVLNLDADDVALNVTKSGNLFIITDCKGYDLILMIVKVFLIVEDVTNISHDLDGTVP